MILYLYLKQKGNKMKVNLSKPLSLAIVFLVYVIATIGGILTFNALTCELWLKLLVADVVGTVITFLFSVIFSNASVYDPYWSVQPIVITFAFLIICGVSPLALVMAIVVAIWGIRLTLNWVYTFHGLGKYQDWRYTMLKVKTGRLYPIVNFLGIHIFPTLVVYACVLPVVYVTVLGPEINVWSALCAGVSLLAVVLQGTADFQMHRFRKSKKGGFIREGLWKYSRHPNYLGEVLMWWGMALCLICAIPELWYLSAGALVNTLMFVFISIPMADIHQSRKEGFSQYKKQTRMLLPLKK